MLLATRQALSGIELLFTAVLPILVLAMLVIYLVALRRAYKRGQDQAPQAADHRARTSPKVLSDSPLPWWVLMWGGGASLSPFWPPIPWPPDQPDHNQTIDE